MLPFFRAAWQHFLIFYLAENDIAHICAGVLKVLLGLAALGDLADTFATPGYASTGRQHS